MIRKSHGKYHFTEAQILWAQKIKRANEISSEDLTALITLWRDKIDKDFDLCETCHTQIAAEFSRLCIIMQNSEEFEDILKYTPQQHSTKATSVGIVKLDESGNLDKDDLDKLNDGNSGAVIITETGDGMTKEMAFKLVNEYLEEHGMEDALFDNEVLISIGETHHRFKDLAEISGHIHEGGDVDNGKGKAFTAADMKGKTKNQIKTLVMEIKGKKLVLHNKSLRVVVKDALEILNFSND